MIEKLDTELKQVNEKIRRKQKLESMLRESRQLLTTQVRNKAIFKLRLGTEKKDVAKLEGISLTGLFYSVLGSKEEQLEKERQELLAAKLKYEEAVETTYEFEQEINAYQTELESLTDIDIEFENLLQQKEDLLTRKGDEKARKLLDLSARLSDLEIDSKELKEAVQAGTLALFQLNNTLESLNSASNWGTWDMLGGGTITTAIKHSKIDEARNQAHSAQRSLRHFQEELADAGKLLKAELEIDGFSKFGDFFFDGLIFDWVVQSKINNAASACTNTINKVTRILNQCKHRLAEIESCLKDLNKQRLNLIQQ